jgi:alkylation response protein AidB-like acyl-CoA dehydrogenase
MSDVAEKAGTAAAEAVATIAELAAGPIADAATQVDRDRAFPAAGIEALREAGALRLAVPAGDGGLGGGLGDLARACDGLPDALGRRGDAGGG